MPKVVREIIKNIGCNRSGIDRDGDTCAVISFTDHPSPDIPQMAKSPCWGHRATQTLSQRTHARPLDEGIGVTCSLKTYLRDERLPLRYSAVF